MCLARDRSDQFEEHLPGEEDYRVLLAAQRRHERPGGGRPGRWEPKKLRYRIFTIPATLACSGRRIWLHLSTRSPWAALTLTGLHRLADLAPG